MQDKHHVLSSEQPFGYKLLKGDKAAIFYRNREIMVISGSQYRKLLATITKDDEFSLQLYLAKVTGHFKHGNER